MTTRTDTQRPASFANVTARMSDARHSGVKFDKWRDDKGVYRYRVVERARVTTGEAVPLW